MIDKIKELEEGLQNQLSSLANDIRAAEASLMATKEGYLKVQGALEILDILKQNIKPVDDQDNINIALG
jgi:hypothetical protein